MQLTERQHRKLYQDARMYLRRIYPGDEVALHTKDLVAKAAAKAMGGKAEGSNNAIVHMFVEWYRMNVAPPDKLVINRPYKHDRLMQASIARLTDMPVILSMNSRSPKP